MPKIFARHRTGFRVELDDVSRDKLELAIDWLLEHGFQPDISGDQWQRTPDGLPICGKHQIAMTARSKQGQSWYSHRIILETGEERYCRGYNTGRPDDGFHV